MLRDGVPATDSHHLGRSNRVVICGALVAVTALLLTSAVSGQSDSDKPLTIGNPEWAGEPVSPTVIRKRLMDLPVRASPWTPVLPVREVNPLRSIEPQIRPQEPPPEVDPLLTPPARTVEKDLSVFTTPRFTVSGQYFTGAYPPDTMGEVGTTHFVQAVNGASGAMIAVYSKANGSLVGGPLTMAQLSPAGDLCETATAGDGVVVFDQLAKRWLFIEFVDQSTGSNRLCIYLSTGENPLTSFWTFYGFNTPIFPDYPKVGVWPDGYYISTNEQLSGAIPSGYILDRSSMLASQAAGILSFSVPPLAAFGFQALTPADLDGSISPPSGAPGIYMRHRDDEAHNPPGTPGDFLEIWEVQVDFQNPDNSGIFGPFEIAVAGFNSNLCGLAGASDACVPQHDTSQGLDTLKQVIMWRLSYRNFGTHESLLGNFTVDINGFDVAGIRWFELRRSPPGVGSWNVYQEGTLGSSTEHRWMGSIAMDRAGNIALGYSTSSSSHNPRIAYTGREAGGELGVMTEPERIVWISTFPQISNSRWGDYSSLTVDPSDDFTFWFTTETVLLDLILISDVWTTEITSFSFEPRLLDPDPPPDGCTPSFLAGFETDPSGDWTLTNEGVFAEYTPRDWEWTADVPEGGTGSAFFGIDSVDIGDCVPGSDDQSGVMHLDSQEITIIGVDPKLLFDHWVATEPLWDGGNVKISVNNDPFQIIAGADFIFNAYNGALNDATTGNTNPIGGEVAFTGTDGGSLAGSWGRSQIDLSNYASPGDRVVIRFDLGVDGCNGAFGWYVDNVGVCDGCSGFDTDGDGIPDSCDLCLGDDASGDGDEDGVCTDVDCDDNNPDVAFFDSCGVCGGDNSTCAIFEDGFESGDASAWS